MNQPTDEQMSDAALIQVAKQVMEDAKFPFLATMDGEYPKVRPVSRSVWMGLWSTLPICACIRKPDKSRPIHTWNFATCPLIMIRCGSAGWPRGSPTVRRFNPSGIPILSCANISELWTIQIHSLPRGSLKSAVYEGMVRLPTMMCHLPQVSENSPNSRSSIHQSVGFPADLTGCDASKALIRFDDRHMLASGLPHLQVGRAPKHERGAPPRAAAR